MGARKAWFFFDDEFVCLGAGIYGGSENSVATTVNQCLLKGSVETSRGILPQGLSHLPNVPWVLHDSIGYVFPKGGDLYVRAQTITGRWGSFTAYAGDGVDVNADVQKPVFKFWIHHGVKPSGAKYAYIVVPGKSSAEVAAYAQNPPIEVLSNSSVRQAVRHRGLKILQIVFVKPGTQSGVTVDQPCLLMLNEETGRVTVSNPFNAPIRINVAVGERSLVFNLTGGKSVTQ
jgi:chondroitin AC lyase